MVSPTGESLFEKARSLAHDVFDTDESRANADKVCAVALHLSSDASVALFSGGPGFKKLASRTGGDQKDAERAITDRLTMFLKSDAGGSFTDTQITQRGFDKHKRGAMNCAEPKVLYYIKYFKQSSAADWVIIPFNKTPGGIVYNPPCKNCRRWVYGQFHALSKTIAVSYGGQAALDN